MTRKDDVTSPKLPWSKPRLRTIPAKTAEAGGPTVGSDLQSES